MLRSAMTATPTFTLRPARPADGEAVARMCAALSRHLSLPAPLLTPAAFRRDGFGARPAFRGIVAQSEGAAIGYALHGPDYNTDRMLRSVELLDLYVEPDWRRRGVGSALMSAVAKAGQAHGARMMAWAVRSGNTVARSFYARYGREDGAVLLARLDGEVLRKLAAEPATAFSIRQAEPADAGGLAKMLAALLLAMGETVPTGDLGGRLTRDGFAHDPAFTALLAEHRGETSGYSLFWPHYDTETAMRGLLLSDLYVAAQARRAGLGRALMAAVGREARSRGADYLFWEVPRTNTPARAFYAALGAVEQTDRFFCYCEGERFEALAAGAA